MAKKQDLSLTNEVNSTIKSLDPEARDNFIDACSTDVFRTFLPAVSQEYSPTDTGFDKDSLSNKVSCLEVATLVENEKERMTDCLKTVYQGLANTECSVALVIYRTKNNCRISMAVGNPGRDPEITTGLAEQLQNSFRGNFPGSKVITDSLWSEYEFFGQLESAENKKGPAVSVAAVSNVASNFSDDYDIQGIEKLIDGIRPSKDGEEYTLLILGETLTSDAIREEKEKLFKYYSDLSPFMTTQINYSESEGRQENVNILVAGKGGSSNKDSGVSVDTTDYKVKYTLDTIEKQMQRLEESSAYGLWNYAAYVLSPDVSVTRSVASMFLSLTQGKESNTEPPAINVWNNSTKANEINRILKWLAYLQHPRFIRDHQESDDPTEITATTIVSGVEFARAMSFPQKSVPGFSVFKCARFGRNISKYSDSGNKGIDIGKIYHMRSVEETPVALDKNSLASHVFVAGSTGAGKTNTVLQILTKSNTPFLVIEPAKGEYKDTLGDRDVRVLGTNPKIMELLRIDPFAFPENIAVSEHVDRLVELFNVCWPMYAAMPAILKDAVIKAYESTGWDMELSENRYDPTIFPTFTDVHYQIKRVVESSDYSADNKSDYIGALVTRVRSLTNGINGQIFSSNAISDQELFDGKVIVDLSRIGSTETRAMIMGILVMKLQEYRLACSKADSSGLKHITVLEEAHNLLRRTFSGQMSESANLLGKAVEMLTNSIAELRSFGEGFIIADQAPGLLDMAVIRNTNTKIIHRLPDQSDRELAGKAAGLDDEQISELAKLELGVAAIYQNDWIEAVLCKIDEFRPGGQHKYIKPEAEDIIDDRRRAKKMVQDILLSPNEFVKIDRPLIMRSNLPAQAKIMVMNYGKEKPSDEERAKLFYLLNPEIRLDFKKNERGGYCDRLYADIQKSCGELSKIELKKAAVYILLVSDGLSRVKSSVYEEMKKELNL